MKHDRGHSIEVIVEENLAADALQSVLDIPADFQFPGLCGTLVQTVFDVIFMTFDNDRLLVFVDELVAVELSVLVSGNMEVRHSGQQSRILAPCHIRFGSR